MAGAILIGFQDQGNLGLGYLSAVLQKNRYDVSVLDFRLRHEEILKVFSPDPPLLVGFSLIFQYYLTDFKELAKYLRGKSIGSHFCIGGHFPTLRYQYILETVPEIDSVIRCEGELTLLELMQCLEAGVDWRDIEGIAYRLNSECIATPPRPLIEHLDDLPYPKEINNSLAVLGKRVNPILASRGCFRNCAFCSIRQFYSEAPGKKVRVRSPKQIVEEMKIQFEKNNISVFLFQDDDFPIYGKAGGIWIDKFLNSLKEKNLIGKIIWKISCRSDEIDKALFARMRAAGLYMVYLGIESGNESGLKILNKQLAVNDNFSALNKLKELEIAIAYGFMLFDPSSTFDSLKTNIAFLRQICADGLLPVIACRMLPYAGTPIEKTLAQEGRLQNDPINPDYTFKEKNLNTYYNKLLKYIQYISQGTESLTTNLTWAWQEYWIMRRLFPPLMGLSEYKKFLQIVTQESNLFILDFFQESLIGYEFGQTKFPRFHEFKKRCQFISEGLLKERDRFVLNNQKFLLEALGVSTEISK